MVPRVLAVPQTVRPLFLAAGWYAGRRVTVSPEIPVDHPAARILAAFGGLTVGRPQAGEDCATDDVEFGELHTDPSIAEWSQLLGTQLVGIAEVHHRHGEWYASGDGRVFGRSCIHDAFWLAGETFGEAVERSLLGRRVSPLLRPDQQSVSLYGNTFTADSPGVYRYR
jgi:hypothetical protein